MYKAQEQDCMGCPVKGRYIYGNSRGPKTLMVPLEPDGINLSNLMVGKIESEQGRKIYTRGIAIIEPIFANLRTLKKCSAFHQYTNRIFDSLIREHHSCQIEYTCNDCVLSKVLKASDLKMIPKSSHFPGLVTRPSRYKHFPTDD